MRSLSRRGIGFLAFMCMLLRLAAPELGHTCSMDPRAGSSAGSTAGATVDVANAHLPVGVSLPASAADAHPAAHHGHAIPDGIHEAAPSSPDESSPTPSTCECADWCCCIPALIHTPAVSVVATTETVQERRVAVSPRRQPLPSVPHGLPFATAPPAV